MNSCKYIIVEKNDINNVNFDDLCEISESTVRWNSQKSKFVAKTRDGIIPKWYIGKPIYNTHQIRHILKSNW